MPGYTEKTWREKWDEAKKNAMEATQTDPDETLEAKLSRISLLEADPEAWFRYYFPKYCYAPAARFQKEATKRVLENPEWWEVRIWSRELAKSTRTMMEVLYLTLVGNPITPLSPLERDRERSKKQYVLMISNSLDNATRLFMPYRANLEFNQRIINDYGKQERIGKWNAAEFITQNSVAFRALGAGQSPRGTRNEEARPDVILFDDIDTDMDCRNPDIVKDKWQWIEEAAIGTRSISQPTLIIFCGNRIAKDCCIERATHFADHVDEVNIKDKDGNSSWPEKNSETDIMRVLSQKSYLAIQKEYFNNPVTEGSVFKVMAYKPVRPIRDYQLLVCYTDPSFRESSKSDFKATVLVGYWQGEFHIIKCFVEQTSTAQMIEWHYYISELVRPKHCYFKIEGGFIQDMFIKEFHDPVNRKGRPPIPIDADKRNKQDKFSRIECLLEPLNRNGKLYLNLMDKDNPHMKRLEEQFLVLSPNSRAYDDGPDAVEGAVYTIYEKLGLQQPGSHLTYKRPDNPKRF